MTKKKLHITNGDSLAERIQELEISGEVVIWREILCEGPTVDEVNSALFLSKRKQFFKETFLISEEDYEEAFVVELNKLIAAEDYEEINLWFEFDLFCHINMIAVISILLQKKVQVPVYLLCSERLEGEKTKGLAPLNNKQLLNHFEQRIELKPDDLELANLVWEIYCGKDPQKLNPGMAKSSNFEYLSSSMRAHLQRFPNVKTGLNTLEINLLKIIKGNTVNSHNQLLGYALQYQGYYGYNDDQMLRLIDKMAAFFEVKDQTFVLTQDGTDALDGNKNFYRDIKDSMIYGGAQKYDYLYDDETHHIMKL